MKQIVIFFFIVIIACKEVTPQFYDEQGNGYILRTRCDSSTLSYTWGTGFGIGMDGKMNIITGYAWRQECVREVKDTIMVYKYKQTDNEQRQAD